MSKTREINQKEEMALRKNLYARLHIAKSQINMSAESYQGFLSSYGVESSTELTTEALRNAVSVLEAEAGNRYLEGNETEGDIWRKRVIASIFAYYKSTHREANIDFVKATALRASGDYKHFNAIPVQRLRAIYFSFVQLRKTVERGVEIMNEDLEYLQSVN